MAAVTMTEPSTEPKDLSEDPREIAKPVPKPARKRGRGPDRVAVALFSLAAFLLILAFLSVQLRAGTQLATATASRPREIIQRRVYRTTVVERVFPAGTGGSASSGSPTVSQSVSGSAAPAAAVLPAAPVTRAS